MKKYFILFLLILLSLAVYGKPIKEIPENILQTITQNMQVEDCMLPYDKPIINIGNPYSWIITYNPGAYNRALVNIPCGAVADVKTIKLKYKVIENGGTVRFYGRYNTNFAYDIDYSSYTMGLPFGPKCEKILDLPKDQVVEVSYDNPAWGNNLGFMQAVGFDFSGSNKMVLEIMSVELINSKGEVFDLFSYDWSMRAFECPPGVDNTPLKTKLNSVYTGMTGLEVASEPGRKRILRLKELVPNLGCDGNGYAHAMAYYKDFFNSNDISAYYQFGGSCDIEPSVSEVQGHLVNSLGESRDNKPGSGSVHHEFDWSNEDNINSFKEAIKRCGDMGIPEFQFIDAVWQYNGSAGWNYDQLDWTYGNWGYGEKTIANFRKALKEEDSGLIVGKYGTKGRRMFFHEYMKKYTGVSVSPEDLGLKSWDEYIPCLNGYSKTFEIEDWKNKTGVSYSDLNFFTFIMVRHYEWLKLFSEVGDMGTAHGCDVVAMPNGSNWASGNDYLGLMELNKVKVIIDESRFYRPTTILLGYSELPTWKELMKKYNKHHRLIVELGAGGGGDLYFAPMFSYMYIYSLQATAQYNSMQVDWVWGGVNENSDPRGTRNFVDFLFKAWGYNDATSDKGERLGDFNKVIRLTTPTSIYVASPISNIVPERFKSSFKYSFYNNPYPNRIIDFAEYNMLSPKSNLIIVDTLNIPKESADKITEDVFKNKTNILLHSFSAGCESDGKNYQNTWNETNKYRLQKPLTLKEETRKVYDRPDLYLSEHINNPTLFGGLLGKVLCDGITEIKGSVNGIALNYKGEYYSLINDNAKILLSINNMPILSEITLDNGSKVFYYHINAGNNIDLDNYVLDIVYNKSNIKKEAVTDNAHFETWKINNGAQVVAMFNKNSFNKYAGPPIRQDYLEVMEPNAVCSSTFTPIVKGKYVIYDFVDNKVSEPMDDRSLTIKMENKTSDLYYIIPLDKSEEMIKELKARREKVEYWDNYWKSKQ